MIRIGIGGWVFPAWRGSFYPAGLAHTQELGFAARALSSIEINGTYYRSQTVETFARWHDETPDDFVFAVKAPRFATNRKRLADGGASIERFFASGVMQLGAKLGPVNWQFMATKQFDAADFEAFLRLLPRSVEGRTLRHAVEVRHQSFVTESLVSMARDHGVAIALAGDSQFPGITALTAPFVYVRIMGTQGGEALGYSDAALDRWAARLEHLAAGALPDDLVAAVAPAPEHATPRDVFAYVIGGDKARNPAAAGALIRRLGGRGQI